METTKPNEAVDPRYPDTPIGIVRSRDAFLRDLPTLLANPKYDRWSVAYCGDERIGIAESQLDLIRECKRRGLHRDQYFIGCIFPHSDEIEEEIDTGFHEFDDIEDDVDDTPNGPDSDEFIEEIDTVSMSLKKWKTTRTTCRMDLIQSRETPSALLF